MPTDTSTDVFTGPNLGNGGDGWWQSRFARALAYRPQLGAAPLRKPHRESANKTRRA